MLGSESAASAYQNDDDDDKRDPDYSEYADPDERGGEAGQNQAEGSDGGLGVVAEIEAPGYEARVALDVNAD